MAGIFAVSARIPIPKEGRCKSSSYTKNAVILQSNFIHSCLIFSWKQAWKLHWKECTITAVVLCWPISAHATRMDTSNSPRITEPWPIGCDSFGRLAPGAFFEDLQQSSDRGGCSATSTSMAHGITHIGQHRHYMSPSLHHIF